MKRAFRDRFAGIGQMRMANRRVAALLLPLLLLAALGAAAGQEEATQRASDDLAFCGRAFGALRRCLQDLGRPEGLKCCALLLEFRAQGCACPGCDDTADTDEAEALNSKGLLWMRELEPLDAACGLSDDGIGGEASLPLLPTVVGPKVKGSLAGEATLESEGADALEEMSMWSGSGEQEEGESEEWEVLGDAAVAARPAGLLQLPGSGSTTVEQAQQAGPTEEQLYESDNAKYAASGDEDEDLDSDVDWEEEGEGEEEEGSGTAAVAAGSAGAGEDWWAGVELGVARDAALFRTEAAASSEDFPSSFPGAGQPLEQQQGGDQQQQGVGKEGGEVLLSRTRTLTLDMELLPHNADQAAKVVQKVLEHATAGGLAGGEGSPLSAVSRKVSIDIHLDGPGSGATLGQMLGSWASSAAAQPGGASLRAQLAARLAAAQHRLQEGGSSGAACQCLGVELPGQRPGETALHYHWIAARLALCQFSCRHRMAITVALLLEMAVCLVWLTAVLLRRGAAQPADAYGCTHSGAPAKQFVVCAADPEWQKPLLQHQVC